MEPKTKQVLKYLAFAGFFFSFYSASTLYMNSSFLAERMSETMIGFVYAASSVLSIISAALLPHMLSKLKSQKTGMIWVAIAAGSLVTMTLDVPTIARAVAFILYFTSGTILFLFIDILIESWGHASFMGRIRGIYLTACNIGFMVSPFIAGYFVDRLGYVALYRLTLVFLIPVAWLLFTKIPPTAITHTANSLKIFSRYKKFLASRDLRAIYIVNFLLQFFYAWMVIYAPILLHEHFGLAWDTIGIIFSVTLAAFVVLQTPAGFLADRIFGEKEFLVGGFIIMGIATIYFGMFKGAGVIIGAIMLILFMTRVGASIIEVMSDSYFFKKVPSGDTASIGFFRNTYPLAYLIGPLLASGLLRIVSIQTLFIILGFICFIGVYFSLRIRDTR